MLYFDCDPDRLWSNANVVFAMPSTLRAYTTLFLEHRGMLPMLNHIRMEAVPVMMELAGLISFFMRGVNLHGDGTQGEEELLAAFEDALLGLPALRCVEFVFDSLLNNGDVVAPEAKLLLKNALEGRLPRLRQNGTVRVGFRDEGRK